MNKTLLVPFLALLAGCPEYSYTELRQKDVFQQNRRNAVDLLVVIDNSCSMVEEQGNLSDNFENLIGTFTGADVDWQIAVTTTDVEEQNEERGFLIGGDDEVVVRTSAGEIDRVAYDRRWIFTAGTSLQLDTEKYRWNSNDTFASWCASTGTFGDGSKGSPGEWNAPCAGGTAEPPAVEADDGPVAAGPGDLIVTEIMAWSLGDDTTCEWVELTNTTDDTLDLADVSLSDLGRNHVEIDAYELAPYGAVVVGRSSDSSANCGTPVDIAFPEGLTLNQDIRIIDNDTPAKDEIFAEIVNQGTTGSGIEMGLESARLVFEEPQFTEQNQGFLREDANFSILFVSDEEDSSPYPADAYVRYFTDLKGDIAYRNRQMVRLSAVVGKDPPPDLQTPSCASDAGVAWYGSRYLAVVNETQGLSESICEEDFAPIVERLGLTLSGLVLEFELSEWPQPGSLEVALYAGEENDTKIADLVEGTDYTYVADGNYLLFVEEQVPPSEYFIVADYVIAPRGPTDTDGAE